MLRTIVALVVATLLSTVAYADKRVALLIGNQGYSAKVGPLKNPHNDVALVSAALRSLQFKVTEVKDANYRTLDTAIKRHIQTVRREGQGAISLVYYSGHGAADPDTKINYLIPVDVADVDDDDLWINSLNLNAVIEALQAQAPQATHYVVFDACRNELKLTRKDKRALVDRGFVPMAYTTGVMIAYATAPGRTATDLGTGGAPYAKALADEIVKPGVEAMTMFRRVALRVNREIGQDPWISASTLPEVYFANEVAAKPPAPDIAPPPAPQMRLSEAAEAWDRVKDTKNVAVLQVFSVRFKDTFYAELAQQRLDGLKKEEIAALVEPLAVKPPLAAGADDHSVLGRALKIELKRVGCDPGPVDSAWGGQATRALAEFVRQTKISIPAEGPSEAALRAVTEQKGRICPLRCSGGETEVGGKCVARPRPAETKSKAAKPRQAAPENKATRNDAAKGKKEGGGTCWAQGLGASQFVPCGSAFSTGQKAF